MDSSLVRRPIFEVMPNLDPFFLYGDKERNGNDDSDEEALKELSDSASLRARLKQMLMEQRDLRGMTSLRQVEQDLDHIISLEGGDSDNDDSAVPRVLQQQQPHDHNVINALGQLSVVFSQIFQALLILKENASNDQLQPSSSAEFEKLSRRSREFEVRLNRSIFELKQKVDASQHRMNRGSAIDLPRVLRCAHSLLKSYLCHLPLAGRNLYPRSLLEKALPELSRAAELTKLSGYEVGEFQADVKRLTVAAAAVNNGKIKSSREVKQESKKDDQLVKKKAIAMIDNLAREKFGTGSPKRSPKKTNLKTAAKVSFPSLSSSSGNRMEGVHRSSRAVVTGQTTIQETARDAMTSDYSLTSRLDSRLMQQHPISMVSQQHPTVMVQQQDQRDPKTKVLLRLDDDELSHILQHRGGGGNGCIVDFDLPLLGDNNPVVGFVSSLTERIVEEMVERVCGEMFSEDILANILNLELKE